jgi:hypothetical protein
MSRAMAYTMRKRRNVTTSGDFRSFRFVAHHLIFVRSLHQVQGEF